ncbi:MAG TPA: MinD/ParA family protein [Clostridiales bacterium]|nr:MinD/ParA family protein [Clostridiales bacterium]HPV01537.1 MinD/ParA family protein [Clostridiales bacterium]
MDQAEKLRQVIEDLKAKQLRNRRALPAIPAKRTARVIAVTSGKGGVGKTNISVNLAIALSEQGRRVVILDADFGLANIDVLLGIVPRHTLLDVIKGRKNITEILTVGPQNVRFISGGSGVEELLRLDSKQIVRFIENISMLDRLADIIIIDTGAGISDSVMSCIMAADEILLVTTPEPTSITDAYALIKMVSGRDRSKKINLVVNRADSSSEAIDVQNKLVLVADRFLGLRLDPTGYIMNDDAVQKAVRQQQPFVLAYPRSPAARNIREISTKLTGNENTGNQQQDPGVRGFFSRLVGLVRT